MSGYQSEYVGAYLIAGTGIFIQRKYGRRYFKWDKQESIRVINSEDFGKRARRVFGLMTDKLDLMIIVNAGNFDFEKVKHVVDVAKEFAAKVKVIDASMAKLTHTLDYIPINQLLHGDILFITTFPYSDNGDYTKADFFILKKCKSSYRLIKSGMLDINETNFDMVQYDYMIFLVYESISSSVNHLYSNLDKNTTKVIYYDRFDYFLLHGAIDKAESDVGWKNYLKIDDFCQGIVAQCKTSFGIVNQQLIKHGELLPVEIYGIDSNPYSLMYEPHLIKRFQNLKFIENPCSSTCYNNAYKNKLLYYINTDGIPMKNKPENEENIMNNYDDDEFLSESEDEMITYGSWNEFPFLEKTKLVVCIDLKTGLALFHDYRTYGKHYIKRLWEEPRELTKETCELIFVNLPKVYKYRIINIIGDLDEEAFKNAQNYLQLRSLMVFKISPLKAELMHIIRLLGYQLSRLKSVNIKIQRNYEIDDYYFITNYGIINELKNVERRTTDDVQWSTKCDLRISVNINLALNEGHYDDLIFKDGNDGSNGIIQLSAEELRLFGAFANAKLLLKKCNYQNLKDFDVKIEPIEDFSQKIKKIKSGKNIKFLLTIEESRAKIELTSENGTIVVRNSDGHTWTPLYFAYAGDVPEVGEIAKDYYESHPEYVVYDIFKFLKTNLNEVKINPEWKFQLIENEDEMHVIMETPSGKRKVPVNVIFGCILKAIIEYAEQNVKKVIDTVNVKVFEKINNNQKNEVKNIINLYARKSFGDFL